MKKKSTTLATASGGQSIERGLYSEIRHILQTARVSAYRSVNFIMVEAYWNVGRLIVEEEQQGSKRAGYGDYLIVNLSKKLTGEFGRGFDERNLRNMRAFYLSFPIRNALRSELSWTHYRLLLKVEKEDARKYYMDESSAGNWSTRQLERQINSFYYERILASRNKKPVTLEAKEKLAKVDPEQFIYDPYVLEFLN